ncbi:MAG: competence/damage-inducible protein A [Halobacteriaceae archaeon]
MRVAVVTVGDELLVGDTVNTNAAWLGHELTDTGATVRRVVTIPDDEAEIAATVADLASTFDAVVVTGGLGPTHDDRTMAGVAAAFDRQLVDHPDAIRWFEAESDYAADDLDPGTTQLPEGGRFLPNEVGVAPGVVVENVYVLPGVPEEMKTMFATVVDEFDGPRRYVEIVLADEPESSLVDRIDAVRNRFDVTVGSYPGDHVRLKLEGVDEATVTRAANWLRDRVDQVPETEG